MRNWPTTKKSFGEIILPVGDDNDMVCEKKRFEIFSMKSKTKQKLSSSLSLSWWLVVKWMKKTLVFLQIIVIHITIEWNYNENLKKFKKQTIIENQLNTQT